MKPVTRVHTCIISRDVMDYVIQTAGLKHDGHLAQPIGRIEFMTMPPPERLVSTRVVLDPHPLPDGSVLTKIEVTELEGGE